MKMKKMILLFSMIVVFFSLTACSNGQEKVTFDYTNIDIIYSATSQAYQLQNASDAQRAYFQNIEDEAGKVTLTGISNMDNAREECGEFKGYRSKESGDIIIFDFSRFNTQDAEELANLNAELVDFIGLVDAKVEESGSNVIVTLTAVYEKCDVEYSFVYEENPAYAYAYDLFQQNVTPYQAAEITATPNYTFGEKMAKAGANTLMGMGTVFVVLIFISLIIGQFEKLDKIFTKVNAVLSNWWSNVWRNRKNKETNEKGSVATPPVPVVAVTTNPMDDTQLVAVITAAVTAASSASGGSDKLVVRSIRKAKR